MLKGRQEGTRETDRHIKNMNFVATHDFSSIDRHIMTQMTGALLASPGRKLESVIFTHKVRIHGSWHKVWGQRQVAVGMVERKFEVCAREGFQYIVGVAE